MTAELTDTRADWGPQRSKTITWHEPGPSTAKGLTMAGLDYLQAMADGRLPQPPIGGLMEFGIVEAETVGSYSPAGQTNPPTTRSVRFTAG